MIDWEHPLWMCSAWKIVPRVMAGKDRKQFQRVLIGIVKFCHEREGLSMGFKGSRNGQMQEGNTAQY
jgi:hypothetical protein